MWERIFSGSVDVWRGGDAEGRSCYAITQPKEGVSVEPSGTHVYYDIHTVAAQIEDVAGTAEAHAFAIKMS